MSSVVIYFFLKVFIPTESAISHPVIRPSFKSDFRQLTSFLHVEISPASNAHSKDPRKASSPKFYIG